MQKTNRFMNILNSLYHIWDVSNKGFNVTRIEANIAHVNINSCPRTSFPTRLGSSKAYDTVVVLEWLEDECKSPSQWEARYTRVPMLHHLFLFKWQRWHNEYPYGMNWNSFVWWFCLLYVPSLENIAGWICRGQHVCHMCLHGDICQSLLSHLAWVWRLVTWRYCHCCPCCWRWNEWVSVGVWHHGISIAPQTSQFMALFSFLDIIYTSLSNPGKLCPPSNFDVCKGLEALQV